MMPFPTYNTHSLATIIPTAISTSTISTALSTYTQRIECRGFGISTIVYYFIFCPLQYHAIYLDVMLLNSIIRRVLTILPPLLLYILHLNTL